MKGRTQARKTPGKRVAVARRRQLGHDVREDPRRRRRRRRDLGAPARARPRDPGRPSATATTCRASTCRCGLRATSRLDLTCSTGAEQVYLSVPSQSLRENLRIVRAPASPSAIVVSLMKGVEKGTGQRMSEVIGEELRHRSRSQIAVDLGPEPRARDREGAADRGRRLVDEPRDRAGRGIRRDATRYFRSFVNTDVIGTEFGGVLKNLIAVAIGIVDGVGYGENTKASIITRGLVEMTDFAVAYGAHPETLSGPRRARRPHRDLRVAALAQQHRRAPARPGLRLQRGHRTR